MTDAMLRHAAWMARCLGRGDLFPFSPREVEELAATIGVRRVPPGTRLLREGEPVDFIGLVEEGEVELARRVRLRRVVLQILRSGDMLGDIPFFCRTVSPFDARALTAAVLVAIDGPALARLFASRPAICQRFLYSLASRLERMQRRLLELTTGDLRSQVAALLLDETGGAPGVLRVPQATLAQLLGATRPSVNRILKAFEAEGLLRLRYRAVEVVDAAALRRAASPSAERRPDPAAGRP